MTQIPADVPRGNVRHLLTLAPCATPAGAKKALATVEQEAMAAMTTQVNGHAALFCVDTKQGGMGSIVTHTKQGFTAVPLAVCWVHGCRMPVHWPLRSSVLPVTCIVHAASGRPIYRWHSNYCQRLHMQGMCSQLDPDRCRGPVRAA